MSSTTPQFPVPFKGRHHSGATTQNFLWRQGNVYIMDNHRAAMWCWLQEGAADQDVALLHIDEHYDTLYSRIDEWLEHLPDLRGMSIHDYLALEYQCGGFTVPVIRWDNYLSLFLERYPNQVVQAVVATHKVGDVPRLDEMLEPRPRELPGNILSWLQDSTAPWIVNVDLDYFFCSDEQNDRRLMFSDEYITAIFGAIRQQLDAGRIACLTICLTPDESYTGSWAQAESLCARACAILGVPFELPPVSDADSAL